MRARASSAPAVNSKPREDCAPPEASPRRRARGAVRALAGVLTLMGGAAASALEIHGHRGARGVLPENTLSAFAHALGLGVHALEMDVGITRDGVVVVHHDATLNPDTTRNANGDWLARDTRTPIHALRAAELAVLDVGAARPHSAHARRFPAQRALDGERIPTLAQVIALVARAGNDAVRFNVEPKITPDAPALTPPPAAFAEAVIGVLRDAGVAARATIQSFDWRVLRHVQALAPEIATGYLSAQREGWDTIVAHGHGPSPWTGGIDADAHGGSVPRMVRAAGGRIWSPDYRDLNAQRLAEAHALGLRVIVWTVNAPRDIARMIALGVDGIISDYPQRVRDAARAAGFALPSGAPVAAQHRSAVE
jgi:glycerophosphoryl diester phosphodiesterase